MHANLNGCAAAILLTWCAAAEAAARPPNIVIILADDLGYGELGCQGAATDIPTPHIDSIAEHGIRFTQAYVTAPNCSPSRAGLLTGRIPTRFGYEFNPIGAGNEAPGAGIPPTETTLAELLHGGGYTTALIGKWHLGGRPEHHPLRHGFDEFFGFLHEGHFFVPPPYEGVVTMLRRRSLPGGGEGRATWGPLVYSTHMGHDEPPYDANNPIVRGGQPEAEPAYLTDAFTREAVDFIRRHRERPFFLYLAYNAVHSPLQGKVGDMERFAHIADIHRRIFAAMLASLDDGVGRVLAALREEGLENDTLLIFLSDNGGPTRELTSSNSPLRGGKGDMYEGGLRVPFLAQWKGKLPAGRVEEHPIVSVDILPTAAAAAGIEPLEDIDGFNLLPYLSDDPDAARWLPRKGFFWRQGARTALRRGDWKLVSNSRDPNRAEWELYNIAEDQAEANDLADRETSTLDALKREWLQINGAMREPAFK